MRLAAAVALVVFLAGSPARTLAATTQKHYYAYDAVEDRHGVIAPWYKGQNGQLDFRARIAAETLKRYPWSDPKKAAAALPEFIFSGAWSITREGTITVPRINDWDNGDYGQRAAYVLSGLVDYYRYSGDPAAIALMTLQGDAILQYALTPKDHPWPEFPVSAPTRGKPYAQADPRGFIQLDIAAEMGIGLLRAYQVTGREPWFEAVKHWADLLSDKRNRLPGVPPWGRYANPQDVPWEDHQTGGVVYILEFLEAVIRAGYTGQGNALIDARDAGAAYLRDVLLPQWTVNDSFGRNYWDWSDPVQAENVTEFAARYLMDHTETFPNWKNDVRNILGLFLNHTSVSPGSRGDVYSGAWAYPESSSCCGRSLWYPPMNVSPAFAQYGVLAGSEWGRELARRQMILATYDCHETGVVEDNIDGGQIVAGAWFKIAHPMALKYTLAMIGWLPEVFGAARENHIVRSSSVVTSVTYGKGRILYTTADAPVETVDVLRLAFKPRMIRFGPSAEARGAAVTLQPDGKANGYQVKELPGGDCIVTIRHDGNQEVLIEGDDPQEVIDDARLQYEGAWQRDRNEADFGGESRASTVAGSAVSCAFTGNQVRVIGRVHPEGGLADVYLDGVRQLVGIDAWNPTIRHQQVVYYRNGLPAGQHTLKIVVRGRRNSVSKENRVHVDAVQFSAATGESGFGEGGGPADAQHWILGYTAREDYVDSQGNAWRPATEVVVRLADSSDSVASSWYTQRTRYQIDGTRDPELYRYGMHARDFWADFTVGPGTWHVRIKCAESRSLAPASRAMNIAINGTTVASAVDIAASALGAGAPLEETVPDWDRTPRTGLARAVDFVFNGIQPKNGVISVRFTGSFGGEAMAQAISVTPGDGTPGTTPVSVAATPARPDSPDGNLLTNGGFEEGAPRDRGALGKTGAAAGWQYALAGADVTYLWAESDYSKHPEWGLPILHGGREAVRTHADRSGHSYLFQLVPVAPGKEYIASAWVLTANLRGKGFGTQRCDVAALRVQELDEKGSIVVDHPRQAVRDAGAYRRLSLAFTTSRQTARVRFVLEAVIGEPYDESHVTWDDCSLVEVRPTTGTAPATAPASTRPQ